MNLGMRLWQKPSGVFYIEFERGKHRSLKTKNESEAKRAFALFKKEALAGRLAEITGQCAKTLGEFYDEFTAWGESAQERSTFRANRLALEKLIHHAGRSCKLDRISPRHVDLMRADAKKSGLRPASISCYVRHSRAALNKAVEWGYIKANPLAKAKEEPREKRPPVFIHPKDVLRFLGKISDVDRRRLLTAYIYTGRRRTELLGLRWENVNMEAEEYLIEKSKAHLHKWYSMHPMFKAVLQSIGPKKGGRVFDRWDHPDTISDIAKEELRAAGYPDLSLHKLRHTFAVLLKEGGIDDATIGDLLGHTDRRAVEIYAHVTGTRQQAALKVIRGGPIDLEDGKK
ncbi:site-specific integrase [Fundidesulfovibrio butyratiphilus]